jgi:SAM-dependent methyltransferase
MGSNAITYVPATELWDSYYDFLLEVAHRLDVKSVAELGGGARPIIADSDVWGFVPERVVIDISAEELAKADGNVEKRVADLCEPIRDGLNSYDMVLSKMLCEHVSDARIFHQNCFNLLRPGGRAVHFFPTLFAAPFIVNRLLPEDLGRSILGRISPSRVQDPDTKNGKFPALYKWCKGPTRGTLKRYESVGFEVEEWRAGFGHTYYRPVPLLDAAESAKARFLVEHPTPLLTSFAMIVLRKPES